MDDLRTFKVNIFLELSVSLSAHHKTERSTQSLHNNVLAASSTGPFFIFNFVAVKNSYSAIMIYHSVR